MKRATGTVLLCASIVLLTVGVSSAQQSGGGVSTGKASNDTAKGDVVTADNAAAVIEDLSESWRIERDGTGAHTITVKVKIREEAGIAAYGHIFVSYIAGRQSVDLASLVVQKPDGHRVTLDTAGLKDLPPQESGAFDAPTFSDLRIKQVTVPALAVGDELSYRIVITQTAPEVSGQFWAEHTFAQTAVLLHESFEINWPAGMRLGIKVRSGSAREDAQAGAEPSRQVRRWSHEQLTVGEADRKAIQRKYQQLLQGKGDGPDVQISTFNTWDEVAAWFAKLTEHAEQPTDELRTKAAALTAGVVTPAEKLARLHRFVSQDIRYVSLAFGPGRYQPRAAPLVLGNAYGDCKDKHSLLAALARTVGVEVRPVLIGSHRMLDEDLPSPAQFDHVISVTGTGADALWLDSTADGSRPGDLVRMLRGKTGLLVSPRGTATIIRTPGSLPAPQRLDVVLDGVYSVDGRYRLRYRRTQTGDKELAARAIFRQSDERARRRFVESLVKDDGLTGSVKVINVTSADVRDLSAPFWYEYEVESSYQSPLQPKASKFWALAPSIKLPETDADSTDPIDLGPPAETRIAVRYELPSTLAIKPPVAVTLDNPFASYRSTYSAKDGVLTIERLFATKVESVPVGQFPAYKSFRTGVVADNAQDFAVAASTVVPAAGGPMTVEQLMTAGQGALDRRDYAGAVKLFQEATVKEPAHGYAWNSLGWSLAEVGRLDEAIAAYDQQIEVSPYHEYAYSNRGIALWRQKKLDEAAQSFQKQIEIVPLDKWAHTNLGLLRLERKQYADAEQSLEKAVSIMPDDTRALIGLGRAYLALKKNEPAVATFSHAAEASPTAGIWNDVAWYLAEAGVELDHAQQLAEKAVGTQAAAMNQSSLSDIKPEQLGSSTSIGMFWDTLGWVHFKKGDVQKALAYLKPAWDLRQDAIIAEHLGLVYEQLGHRDDAIHAYREALAADKTPRDVAQSHLASLLRKDVSADQVRVAEQAGLAAAHTIRTPQLAPSGGSGEFLFLEDGTGRLVDAKFLSGDPALKTAVARLTGLSTAFIAPEGRSLTLVRRGGVSCVRGAKNCTLVLYLPRDVQSIE